MTEPLDLATARGLQKLVDTTPLHRWLGIEVCAVDPALGRLEMAVPFGPNLQRMDGADQAHGGVLATLIDTAAAIACSATLGRPVPTVALSVDYLRPAPGPRLVAVATVRRTGRSLGLVDVEVTAGGKLVAVGRCTLSTL